MEILRNKEVKKIVLLNTFIAITLSIAGLIFVNITCSLLILSSCILIQLGYLKLTYNRYQDISNLSYQIDQILHNYENLYEFSSYHEGELSILKNEINKILIALKNNGDQLNKEKIYLSDSLADISHQVRTPLTSLNMISSFFCEKDLSDQKRLTLAREMQTLLSRIDWLISTLLKISQIDSGTVKFKKDPISMDVLIEKSIQPFMIPLEVKNIKIEKNGNLDSSFCGDLSWTSEAIGNIIKNSIEYTPEDGTIHISCTENTLYTQMIIQDSGNGFVEEDIPFLFERFYKGKLSSTHSFGIGLALSKMIITNQNGSIKADNQHGARYTIRFYKGVI